MEKNMGKAGSKNRKLIIAIASLSVVILALVGAVVGVLAASSQTLGAGFSIAYDVGNNVAAKVRVSYQIGNGDAVYVQAHNENTNNNYIVDSNGWTYFNADTDNEEGSDSTTEPSYDISLSPDNPTITFLFEVSRIGDSDRLLSSALTGTIGSAFSYSLYRYGYNSATDEGQGTYDFYEVSNFASMTESAPYGTSDSMMFKVVLTVKDTNTNIDASGTINANFALSIT